MNLSPVWLVVSYLAGQARSRARAVRSGDLQAGALTLEWMIIAALIAGAAVTAAAVFGAKVTSYVSKLP
jgi:hypothetical protein